MRALTPRFCPLGAVTLFAACLFALSGVASAQALHLRYRQVALEVSDLTRSTEFYTQLLGLKPTQQSLSAEFFLGEGESLLLMQASEEAEPKIAWIGLAVQQRGAGKTSDLPRPSLIGLLEEAGFRAAEPGERQRGLAQALTYWSTSIPDGSGEQAFFFADGEGIAFRVMAGNCDNCDSYAAARSGSDGHITALGINHFTNFVSHAPRSNALLQELFGLSILSYQGPNAPTLSLGDGRQFLMYFGGGNPREPEGVGVTDHVSLAVEDFDVESLQLRLEGLGLQAGSGARPPKPLRHWLSLRMANRGGAEQGTPELYFSDPDGIAIQLQDKRYCGGSGYLGDECPLLD